MAAKTAIIILAGESYTIHAFNIGELEKVADILADAKDKPSLRTGIEVLKIALARSEPKVDDLDALEGVTMPELNQATTTMLKLAGIDVVPNPPQAETPAA